MESSEAMLQHRAIRLTEEAGAQIDGQIGTDPEDVPVERGVMERAEGEAVGDDRFPAWVAVRQDMGGVEEFASPEATDRAAVLVGVEDTLAEALLVQPALGNDGQVGAARRSGAHESREVWGRPRCYRSVRDYGRRLSCLIGLTSANASARSTVAHAIVSTRWL